MSTFVPVLLAVAAFLVPDPAWATALSAMPLDLTASTYGLIAVLIFVAAYGFVVSEEVLHVRKSKPVIVAAGVIWVLVAMAYAAEGDIHMPSELLRHNLMEYAELMLFLLAAMTYINTMRSGGFSLRCEAGWYRGIFRCTAYSGSRVCWPLLFHRLPIT